MNDIASVPAAGGSPAGGPFEGIDKRDVIDLIGEYPLAWVCARNGRAAEASLLPLLVETDALGRPVSLVGHMARRNPLVAALTADPHALILFTGPQAYVSPELVSEPRWAPTWNYAQLRIEAELRFDAISSGTSLSMIVDSMEQGRARPWTTADMGPRYDVLEKAIIGFRARIDVLHATFKLGQDEPIELLRQILAGHPDSALVRWMRRLNAGRLRD